jgi:MFS transporter, DHA2 family, multidrug resistance protein
MSSTPVRRAGMGSATTDLQRDLGGAIMQSVLGALLTMRYSASFAKACTQVPQQKMEAQGSHLAIAVAVGVAVAGLVLVFVAFPTREREQQIEAKHAAEDEAAEKSAGQAA